MQVDMALRYIRYLLVALRVVKRASVVAQKECRAVIRMRRIRSFAVNMHQFANSRIC